MSTEAEEEVNRNVAPRLKASLEHWLPQVTNERHTSATVGVETLEIGIGTEHGIKPAKNLSHGTAEQIYLLLRIALVDHLTRPDEPCPLLLDDVTVQSDPEGLSASSTCCWT